MITHDTAHLFDPISCVGRSSICGFVKLCASIDIVESLGCGRAQIKPQQVDSFVLIRGGQTHCDWARTVTKIIVWHSLCAQIWQRPAGVKSVGFCIATFLYGCGYGAVCGHQNIWGKFSVQSIASIDFSQQL